MADNSSEEEVDTEVDTKDVSNINSISPFKQENAFEELYMMYCNPKESPEQIHQKFKELYESVKAENQDQSLGHTAARPEKDITAEASYDKSSGLAGISATSSDIDTSSRTQTDVLCSSNNRANVNVETTNSNRGVRSEQSVNIVSCQSPKEHNSKLSGDCGNKTIIKKSTGPWCSGEEEILLQSATSELHNNAECSFDYELLKVGKGDFMIHKPRIMNSGFKVRPSLDCTVDRLWTYSPSSRISVMPSVLYRRNQLLKNHHKFQSYCRKLKYLNKKGKSIANGTSNGKKLLQSRKRKIDGRFLENYETEVSDSTETNDIGVVRIWKHNNVVTGKLQQGTSAVERIEGIVDISGKNRKKAKLNHESDKTDDSKASRLIDRTRQSRNRHYRLMPSHHKNMHNEQSYPESVEKSQEFRKSQKLVGVCLLTMKDGSSTILNNTLNSGVNSQKIDVDTNVSKKTPSYSATMTGAEKVSLAQHRRNVFSKLRHDLSARRNSDNDKIDKEIRQVTSLGSLFASNHVGGIWKSIVDEN